MFSEIKKQYLFLAGFFLMLAIMGASCHNEKSEIIVEDPLAKQQETSILPTEEIDNQKAIEKLLVHVSGCVAYPGVYTVEADQRLIDVLSKAEPLPEANIHALNLAKKLSDQEKIVVPSFEEELESKNMVSMNDSQGIWTEENNESKININFCDAKMLESLNGIGTAKAAAIIQYREEQGLFLDVESIMNVSGIGEATFAKIKSRITV